MGAQPLYGADDERRPQRRTPSRTPNRRRSGSGPSPPASSAPRRSRPHGVAAVPGQRPAVRVPRRGLVRGSVPALLGRATPPTQIALIKNLGLNGDPHRGQADARRTSTSRWTAPASSIDAGFQCCDAWQLPDNGKGVTAHDYRTARQLGARRSAAGLRNHPSILNFSWIRQQRPSAQPGGRLDRRGFRQADFQDPLIASAEYKSSREAWDRPGRRRAPMTGSRPATGTTRPTTTEVRQHAHQRRRRVGVRLQRPVPGATIPTLDSMRPLPVAVRTDPAVEGA